jgi:hypothetical protein
VWYAVIIKANQQMLQRLYNHQVSRGGQLLPRLMRLIDGGIVEDDECWFLTECKRTNVYTLTEFLKTFPDRTYFECLVNKIHIDDETTTAESDEGKLQEQALLYADALRTLLEPHGVFNVIVDFNYTDLDDRPNYMTSTVQFHKVRPGEFYLSENVEESQGGEVLVLTTAPGQATS